MSIAENIAQVKANIERAAIAAGRDPKEILLVGATKMNDADRVREAVAAGLPCCGENRVQELLEKNEAGAYAGADLHFIGTLQKNKAKYLVGLVSLIHSVDSVELMKVRYDKAEANVDKIAGRLQDHQVVLLKDIALLDKLYELPEGQGSISISGVDTDEESLNLVEFQHAYNLASHLIQVLTEVYDRLILQTGV